MNEKDFILCFDWDENVTAILSLSFYLNKKIKLLNLGKLFVQFLIMPVCVYAIRITFLPAVLNDYKISSRLLISWQASHSSGWRSEWILPFLSSFLFTPACNFAINMSQICSTFSKVASGTNWESAWHYPIQTEASIMKLRVLVQFSEFLVEFPQRQSPAETVCVWQTLCGAFDWTRSCVTLAFRSRSCRVPRGRARWWRHLTMRT